MGSKATESSDNDANWWRQACVYQIYPRSFSDANGDGCGDIKGIISRIPYLKQLGVDAVWLSPFYTSPMKDAGYDVADYRDVDPRFGTLQDFEEMVMSCKAAGIRTIVDLVPNHSSEEHPWFQEALKSPPGSPQRARFHFRDGVGKDKSEPPADWECSIGGCAWHPSGDGQFYLGLFGPFQPDLNWDNPEVRQDFLETIRFWANRGVAGFRVDVADCLCKDLSETLPSAKEMKGLMELRKTVGAPRDVHPYFDRDGVLKIYEEWRDVFNEYDPPLMGVAEAWIAQDRIPLYASPKGLGQAFSFALLLREFDRTQYREVVDTSIELARQAGSSTTWVLSNHDMIRHASRYGIPKVPGPWTNETHFNVPCGKFLSPGGKIPGFDAESGLRRARAASLFMLALPGSAYVYQGEELGLPEVLEIPDQKRQCPVFHATQGRRLGRDGCRVPLPWTRTGANFGFGTGEEAWLPQPGWWGQMSVEEEDGDLESTLNLYRKALKWRKELQTSEELKWSAEDDNEVLRFERPGGWVVLLNFSADKTKDLPQGEVLVASRRLQKGLLPPETCVWVRTKT